MARQAKKPEQQQEQQQEQKKPRLLQRFGNYMTQRVGPELLDGAVRMTSQGAAEFGKSLFHESVAYVPYGEGQSPLPVANPIELATENAKAAEQEQAKEMAKGQDKAPELGF